MDATLPGWVANETRNVSSGTSSGLGDAGYDVLIHRLNHPWIYNISTTELDGILELASSRAKVSVVIFVTAHINNNVRSVEEWDGLRRLNDHAREYTKNYTDIMADPSGSSGIGRVQHVFTADVDRYADELFRFNAAALDFDSTNDTAILSMTFKRQKRNLYPNKVAMCCGAPPVKRRKNRCTQNDIFNDGMHFCMERSGPRIMGVFACLIACAFNKDDDGQTADKKNARAVQQCADACNKKFMTLRPVPEAEIIAFNE